MSFQVLFLSCFIWTERTGICYTQMPCFYVFLEVISLGSYIVTMFTWETCIWDFFFCLFNTPSFFIILMAHFAEIWQFSSNCLVALEFNFLYDINKLTLLNVKMTLEVAKFNLLVKTSHHLLTCIEPVLVFMSSQWLVCIENLLAIPAGVVKGGFVMSAFNMIQYVSLKLGDLSTK